jgi:hypothetical protein
MAWGSAFGFSDDHPRMWFEPLFFGMRLQNQVSRRLAILVGCPLGCVIAVLIVAGVVNIPATHAGIAAALFGFLVSWYWVLREDDFGGTVWIGRSSIRRNRMCSWGYLYRYEWVTLPYDSIQLCRIIHSSALGHWFSVLEIHTDSETWRIGIPWHVDIRSLAAWLQSQDVPVAYKGVVAFADLKSRKGLWWVKFMPRAALLTIFIVAVTTAWPYLAHEKPPAANAPLNANANVPQNANANANVEANAKAPPNAAANAVVNPMPDMFDEAMQASKKFHESQSKQMRDSMPGTFGAPSVPPPKPPGLSSGTVHGAPKPR